jgi:acyl-CoA-binding protein
LKLVLLFSYFHLPTAAKKRKRKKKADHLLSLSLQAKAKYQAWKEVKDLDPEDAQKQYTELVNELKEKYGLKE